MSASAPLPAGTRVGLNLVFLIPGETGGMETYVRHLVPQLAATAPRVHFIAFVNRIAARTNGPWTELEPVVVPVDATRRTEWVRGEQQLLPGLAQRVGVQLLHSFASTAPAWGRFRRVVTIHDLIYRTIPEAHPGVRALGMRVLVPLAARRSHRIITPSRSSADDVRRFLRIPADKIDVVPHGISPSVAEATPEAELRERLGAAGRPIVLSPSAKLAHKNLMRLLGAVARLPTPRPVLVLPGYHTAHEDDLRARAAALGIGDDVHFLGWVAPAELEGLYRTAACVVFPSLAEGFGFPVLEAMARGVPVACSERGALGEMAGGAALVFDPLSEESIAAAITRLLTDRPAADRLIAAGRAHAATFTWPLAAERTLASYGRTLSAS